MKIHHCYLPCLQFVSNLVAIVLLSRQAVFLLKDYRQQKKEGKNPVFTKDKMPEIADKLEAW
jgi:AGCS family alanine or glycine:cation symporter